MCGQQAARKQLARWPHVKRAGPKAFLNAASIVADKHCNPFTMATEARMTRNDDVCSIPNRHSLQ
jgi:hypothetical protein